MHVDKRVILVSIPITVLAIIVYMTIDSTTTIPSGNMNSNTDVIEDQLEYFRRTHSKEAILNSTIEGEPFPFDYTARISNHIILGKIKDFGGISERLTPNLILSLSSVTVEVERDLAGYYNDKEITFRTWPSELIGLMPGDRILVFIAREEKGELDPFQGDYFMVMGSVGVYKIVDGKAYGYYHDGIELEELMKMIDLARGERIKEITMKADYIVLGKISDIVPVSTDPDKPEADEYTITANITVDVEQELTNKYREKSITFLAYKDQMKCKIGDRCLVFLKHGYKYDEFKDRIAPYYYIHTYWSTDGYYKVIDGKAYGMEFRYGIDINELVKRIKEYRGVE